MLCNRPLIRPRIALIAATAALCSLAAAGTAAAATVKPLPSTNDVAAAWQFPVKNWTSSNPQAGRVDDVLRIGNKVFIAGNFTISANHGSSQVTRTYLAAENATTGALLAFNPKLDGRAYVLAASPNHKTLYVGGDFKTVNGTSRPHLASFDVATGALNGFIPAMGIDGSVKAISRTSTSLFIGGSFTHVGGVAHARLARLNYKGESFRVGEWDPFGRSADVRDMIADPTHNRVIVAGWFKALDGVKGQYHLASVSMTTGRPLPWAGHAPDPVLDIARSGDRIYAGMAGPGGSAIAYNAVTGKRAWYYMCDGNIQAVAIYKGYPVFGTHGDYVSPRKNVKMEEYGTSTRIHRYKIFELSPTGVLQKWAPKLGTTQGVLGVWALRGSPNMLYVGGDFTQVNGANQARFAMFPNYEVEPRGQSPFMHAVHKRRLTPLIQQVALALAETDRGRVRRRQCIKGD